MMLPYTVVLGHHLYMDNVVPSCTVPSSSSMYLSAMNCPTLRVESPKMHSVIVLLQRRIRSVPFISNRVFSTAPRVPDSLTDQANQLSVRRMI